MVQDWLEWYLSWLVLWLFYLATTSLIEVCRRVNQRLGPRWILLVRRLCCVIGITHFSTMFWHLFIFWIRLQPQPRISIQEHANLKLEQIPMLPARSTSGYHVLSNLPRTSSLASFSIEQGDSNVLDPSFDMVNENGNMRLPMNLHLTPIFHVVLVLLLFLGVCHRDA